MVLPRAQRALLFERAQHAARHLARAADEAGEFLTRHANLHAFRMRECVGLFAKFAECLQDATADIDKGEIAQFARGPLEPCGELRCEFERKRRIGCRDLAEARIGHLGDFAAATSAHVGATTRGGIEQAHLTKEFTLTKVGKNQFFAVLVFDQHFD